MWEKLFTCPNWRKTSSMKDNIVPLNVGDGSAATLRFMKQHILTRFNNPILGKLDDASKVELPSRICTITTDSFIVDPPIFPGGNIGKLAVAGTINDLVASGARPCYLTLSLMITEGFHYDQLEVILDSIEEATQKSSLQIIAGDTKLLDKKSRLGILINTTGVGIPVDPNRSFSLINAQPGDAVIITGTIGDHGLAVLSFREGLGFEQRIQSDCALLDDLILPLLNRFPSIRGMRDPTRGGVLNVLFDIAEAAQVRVVLDVTSFPIREEVRMGCEMLGIDPLLLVNEGKMILLADREEADLIVSTLQAHPLGAQSAIIGEVLPSKFGNGEVIFQESGIFKSKVRPEGKGIPRLC
jgi:hydrogenase expression/formation protein HypE